MTARSSVPGWSVPLVDRLAAAEAEIAADRHRQPVAVLEAIARHWEDGTSVPEIAAAVGISCKVVRDRLRRAGEYGHPGRERIQRVRTVLEHHADELIAAYRDGEPLAALAAEVGTTPRTLSAFLERNGVRLRHDRGWYRRRKRRNRDCAGTRFHGRSTSPCGEPSVDEVGR
jgi:transposase